MPINGTEQPSVLHVDDGLWLRKFDDSFAFALPWYQDTDLVYLVDGRREPYTMEKLGQMYRYLNGMGELYFIEVLESGRYLPIGDVTFSREDMPIVIGEKRYRGRGIGQRVVAALIRRGRSLGYDRLYVKEIYAYNEASKHCFARAGFTACEKTPAGQRYVLDLQKERKEEAKGAE